MTRSFSSLLSLCVLSTLAGCPEEGVIVDPPAPDAPSLQSGVYAVTMTSVERWECRGSRPSDLLGAEFELDLRVHGDEANAAFDGLPMEGSAEPGFVYLDVSQDYLEPSPQPVQEEEEYDVDEASDDDESTVDEDSETDSDDSDEARGSAKCDVDEGDEDMDAPDEDVAEYHSIISLDLAAIDPHNAEGVLEVQVEGCSFEVNLSAVWQGRYQGKEEPLVMTSTGSTGSGSSSGSHGGGSHGGGGCDDGEEDCG
jgi:uncharacterized membrane protein YgcG/predicted small lipoprotein YifL